MPTTTDRPAADTEEDRRLDVLTSEADDGAARLAMDVESIADGCDLVSRRLAELRADLARQRVVLDKLRERGR